MKGKVVGQQHRGGIGSAPKPRNSTYLKKKVRKEFLMPYPLLKHVVLWLVKLVPAKVWTLWGYLLVILFLR